MCQCRGEGASDAAWWMQTGPFWTPLHRVQKGPALRRLHWRVHKDRPYVGDFSSLNFSIR